MNEFSTTKNNFAGFFVRTNNDPQRVLCNWICRLFGIMLSINERLRRLHPVFLWAHLPSLNLVCLNKFIFIVNPL